jgi:hypothetical protein
VKYIIILVVATIAVVGLWTTGFLDDFLGPWKDWANFIGYFQ